MQLFFTPYFPSPLLPFFYSHSLPSRHLRPQGGFKGHCLILGIGGNIGNSFHIFKHLLFWLQKHPKICYIATSPILKNPAFGYTRQPDFYNATLQIQTTLNLSEIFSLVFYLERRFGRGRKRVRKNAPRTLDIDILFFDDLIVNFADLKIPHPYFKCRESVIIPLMLQHL